MAVEPNYRTGLIDISRRVGRASGRIAGRVVGSGVSKFTLTAGASATAGYYLHKYYGFLDRHVTIDFLNSHPTLEKLKNIAICVVGVVAAGAVVLKALTPALLWMIGKLESIEVRPSTVDIWRVGRTFKWLSGNTALSRICGKLKDLYRFRDDLNLAATRNPSLRPIADNLRAAIGAADYAGALNILRNDLSAGEIERHNKLAAVAGDFTGEAYKLDLELYANALLLAYYRVAGEVIYSGIDNSNFAAIKDILDIGLELFDRKEVKPAIKFNKDIRERMGRAVKAANGRIPPPTPPVQIVTPTAAPVAAQPAAIPSVLPPPAPLPPCLRGPGAGTP